MNTRHPIKAAALALTATTTAVLGLRLLRSHLALVRVVGSSMNPTFADGERLLIRRTRTVHRGDAIVFANPLDPDDHEPDPPWLVKRVTALPGDPIPTDMRATLDATPDSTVPPGSLLVRGDATHTQDSRHFGYIPTTTILGIVLTRPRHPRPRTADGT